MIRTVLPARTRQRPALPRPLRAAFFAIFAGALVAAPAAPPPARQPPQVAVTIKPIHGLVSLVMAGVADPVLLISGADSPHTHTVRPSEARALEKADVVFWIGSTLETSFTKPIAALVHGKVVSLLAAPGMTVLPVRPSDSLPDDAATGDDAHGDEAPGASDPHIWLDPENARAMTRSIAAALQTVDPAHAETYAANAAETDRKLAALDAELREKLEPIRGVPFIAYHDAYHYLERRYGLAAVAAVTLSPERAPGARRVRALREIIAARHVVCVFTEPEFEPAIVRTIAEGTAAKIATLDPEGAQIPPGPDFYFVLMRQVADQLRGCLRPSPG